MKKILFIGALFLIIGGWVLIRPQGILWPESNTILDSLDLKPKDQYHNESALVAALLNQYHYQKKPLNDSLSSFILNQYIKSLDPNRSYFLASDIAGLEKYRKTLDDDLKQGKIEPAFDIFNLFKKRLEERTNKAFEILAQPFDFTVDESMEIDREKSPWANSSAELDEIWRKVIKGQVLSLKLSGKTTEEAAKVVKTRYERMKKSILQNNSQDIFQLFMNTVAEAYDPHTNYFSPITSENFKINMSLSLEGIGARLSTDGDFTTVFEIVPGGPAFKSKQLFANDKIVGVAQEKDTSFTDIIGWRVDEVVQLVRGPKGTTVRLMVIPADAAPDALPKEISLVRDKIKLEEQASKSDIFPFQNEGTSQQLGVITIPTFYMDFEGAQRGEKDYKSTNRDVKKLLEELKAKNVQGVVIDLRNNGGGSLAEAVDLTGLFIKDGPVVQVKNSDGTVEVESDTDQSVVYDGPIVVLTNRFSASASEIFSGAIQDYKRGVVMGETTYGKGTVQRMVELNRFLPQEKAELGQVKLTLAKYYRITGGSTQHMGVIPDIALPSPFSAEEFGESSQPMALPWDKINATTYKETGKITSKILSQLNKSYSKRLKTDQGLQDLLKEIEEMKSSKSKNTLSLNEAARKKELEESKKNGGESPNPTELDDSELSETEKSSANLKNDVYLQQALKTLSELIKATLG